MLKVRPISIGSLIYRAYAKLRFAQVGPLLLSSLPDLQLGGLPNLSAETLVLSLLNETNATSHPFGVSLDFNKAFDSCDWALALTLMRRAGMPSAICTAISSAWQAHTRWVTFGSNVDPRPVVGSPALMQGDPFAPYAMALILAAPLRKISQTLPQSFHITYMDDLTAVFPNLQDMEAYLAE